MEMGSPLIYSPLLNSSVQQSPPAPMNSLGGGNKWSAFAGSQVGHPLGKTGSWLYKWAGERDRERPLPRRKMAVAGSKLYPKTMVKGQLVNITKPVWRKLFR
uniref:Uncharacterized protein n=1 Tax=Micrurus lemniscatus lemniscatus TaxID=129467 RepID=A0A2D4HV28_MICLE